MTRRESVLGAVGVLAGACASSRGPLSGEGANDRSRTLGEIEARVGGRVGVFAVDFGTGRQLAFRADERFAMCSTFKWALAAAVLARVDRAQLRLSERVPYGPADLLDHAPATREHVESGAMTIEALAEAAVVVSDNTAANLLLTKLGGPAALTAFFRSQGDPVTRLDRNEPDANGCAPGDPRDTTSPRAMVGLMLRILCGDALSPAGRDHLLRWLNASKTGKARLRAGMPVDWTVGDKTGTGPRSTVNDVALVVRPGHAPILVAAYMTGGVSKLQTLEAAHADIGRLIAGEFAAASRSPRATVP